MEGRRALELDPLSPTANAEFAHALLANDRCDEALAQLEKLRSLRPPLNRAGLIAAECYEQKQMWPEAIAEMQRAATNDGPHGQALLGYLLGRAGRTDEARRVLAALCSPRRVLMATRSTSRSYTPALARTIRRSPGWTKPWMIDRLGLNGCTQ